VRVDVVTIAYNSGTAVERLAASAADSRHEVLLRLFLHSTHGPTVDACARVGAGPRVVYTPAGVNRGISRSWNDGILCGYGEGADVVVVANDDIVFGPGDLDRIAEAAAGDRGAFIVSCAGPHTGYGVRLPSHGYACFAINPIALEEIGCFDENFFPAYCEDQDYSRRAQLAGLREANCPLTEVAHEGSGTIRRDAQLRQANKLSQLKNQEYYRRKWGGDAGAESFGSPFDDEAVPLRIPPSSRRHPYATHDRLDLIPDMN
jgi:GT2 family glycosyltransferase